MHIYAVNASEYTHQTVYMDCRPLSDGLYHPYYQLYIYI